MDQNTAEGTARKFGGQVQDAVGDLTGDSATQTRGKADQVIGTTQEAVGSALDNAERWIDGISEMARSRPLTTVAAAVFVGYTLRALTHWGRG